ncbi:MAG: LuxR C-terminal-related transcriptional regulator [Pseudomonadota bacterium]
MDHHDQFLLDLYGASRELSVGEFPQRAMALLGKLVAFDSARLITVSGASHAGQIEICGAIVHNTPVDMVLDWESIYAKDTILQKVMADQGTALAFHAPTLFAARDKSVVLDYANRFEHLNGVVIAQKAAQQDRIDGLSVYRAATDRHFSDRERLLVERVMPHLQSALHINAMLAVQCFTSSDNSNVALLSRGGVFQFFSPGFATLMALEWPQWRSPIPPDALLEAVRGMTTRYQGRAIDVSSQRVGELIVLRARELCRIATLTAREARIAVLFAQGNSHKEVARQLEIAPATVRNFLQKIYTKLGVNDKGGLATKLAASMGERSTMN